MVCSYQLLNAIGTQPNFIEDDCIVACPCSTLQSVVGLKKESPFAFTNDPSIDDGAVLGITILIAILLLRREEACMVTLAANDNGYFWPDWKVHLLASIQDCRVFVLQDEVVLSLRYSVAIDKNSFR